jgi:hypothetical protein
MSPQKAQREWARAVLTVAVVNLAIGFVAYFIAFLFAYGFDDKIETAQHVVFLVEVGVIAVVSAIICASIIRSTFHLAPQAAFAVAIWTGLALHLTAVGIGSIVSATHKEENSVSADFSTTTDVAVAACLLIPAVAAGWLAWRTRPTTHQVV